MNVQNINFSSETIDSLAHKLRLQKIDKKQIIKYKIEAIQNEKLKNKKKKACNIIQKFFRGFSYRKKFKLIINEINKKMILDYFKERRLKRIQDTYVHIIYRNIKQFLDRRNKIKKKIMLEYINYCANFIRRIFVGYTTRKNCRPILILSRIKKNKISALINSHKVRLILKTRKIQDILLEIANIQNCLFSIDKDQRPSDKTENLKNEFTNRLENLHKIFYEEFYKLKNKIIWMNYSKIDYNWLDQYFKIMTSGAVENVFQISKRIEPSQEEVKHINTKSIKNNTIKIKSKKLEKNQNFENKSQQFSIEKLDDEHNITIIEEKQITISKNINLYENDFIDDKQIPLSTDQIQENSTRTVTNTNDRPIKGNSKNMYDFEQFPEIESEKPISKNKKTKKEKIKKAPKYDARKAIEDSENNKTNSKQNPKKEEREAFRKFLHSMKEGGEAEENINVKENKINKNSKSNKNRRQSTEDDNIDESPTQKIRDKKSPPKYQASPESKNSEQTSTKQLKRKLTNEKNENKISPPNENTIVNKEEPQPDSNTLVETRRGKHIKIESAMRKKLHELERSPPPRIDIKNIKSKINCWSSENNENNLNIKKIKNIDEEFTPLVNKEVIETRPNKTNLLEEIQRDYLSIPNSKDCLKRKSQKMREYPSIPYIKFDSFYIKHYSNEIYEQLLMHLTNHYDELKN